MKLNASHNELQVINYASYFDGLSNLNEIDFSFNKVRIIRKHDFGGAKKLTRIFLSHNSITSIEAGAFMKLDNLILMDLSNNLINFVENLFQKNTKLKTLLLQRNSLSRFTCEFSRLANSGASVYFSWEYFGSSDSVRVRSFCSVH